MRYTLCQFLIVNFLISLWLISTANLYASPQKTEILVIMDASASMEEPFENSNKLQKAKESISEVFTGLPSDFFIQNNVGLRVYGHRYSWKEEAKSCKDTELVFPIGKIDPKSLIKTVNDLKALGSTPIAYSLMKGAEDFSKDKEVRRYILLVSDGAETCGGDPVVVIKELQAKGINVIVNAIGFAVKEDARKQLEAIAAASGGRYYTARASLELKTEMEKLLTKPEPEIEPDNLVAQVNGGKLIASTNKEGFQFLNDGQDSIIKTWFKRGDEAVFAFKDEQPAMIRSLSLPVFESFDTNLKSFELYVSTTSPTSGWEKVGTYELPNLVLEGKPYHVFNLKQPVAARYVKFKVLKSHDLDIRLYELKVFGDLGAEIPAAALEPDNIIAQVNGGKLIASTNKEGFQSLNDGQDSVIETWFKPGDEAVFAFKDEQPATIRSFSLPVLASSKKNLNSFEIYVSTTSPTSGWRKLRRYNLPDLALEGQPYHVFNLEQPVVAKYIKFTVLSGHGHEMYTGGWSGPAIRLYELKVFGDLGAKVEAPEEINLLAASQGGQLIASANNALFSQLIDEREEEIKSLWPGQEAVFAFKGKKIVVLKKLAVPIFSSYIRNIKEILIWASTSENPLKGYEPVGRFEVANMAFEDNPYQEIVFDQPVRARFLKIRLESAQKEREYIVMYELQAYGKFE